MRAPRISGYRNGYVSGCISADHESMLARTRAATIYGCEARTARASMYCSYVIPPAANAKSAMSSSSRARDRAGRYRPVDRSCARFRRQVHKPSRHSPARLRRHPGYRKSRLTRISSTGRQRGGGSSPTAPVAPARSIRLAPTESRASVRSLASFRRREEAPGAACDSDLRRSSPCCASIPAWTLRLQAC